MAMTKSNNNKKATCCLNLSEGDAPKQYLVTLGPSIPLDSKHEALIRYKLQKAKIQSIGTLESAKAKLDFFVQELHNTKLEIENIRLAIKEVDDTNDHLACYEKVNPKQISDSCKLKSSLRQDLSDLLHHESHLRRQLCLSRTEYRNARLDDMVLSEDIKKYRSTLYQLPFLPLRKKDGETQARLNRESQSKKNAIMVREETITSVANSITDHVLQKLPGTHNISSKQLLEAKKARQNISCHVASSFRKARQKKAMTLTVFQLRQNRQQENLAKLKMEISEIKKTLSAKNQIKRMHDEEIAIEKEEVKNLLQSQGANPYLAEYLLALEEKQREVQRRMLVEEQKRLLEMQREYSIIEASKAKETAERKKWDEHWDQKKKEKIAREKRMTHEKYFDVHTDEEEESKSNNIENADERSQNSQESPEHGSETSELKKDSIRDSKDVGSSKAKSPRTSQDSNRRRSSIASNGTNGSIGVGSVDKKRKSSSSFNPEPPDLVSNAKMSVAPSSHLTESKPPVANAKMSIFPTSHPTEMKHAVAVANTKMSMSPTSHPNEFKPPIAVANRKMSVSPAPHPPEPFPVPTQAQLDITIRKAMHLDYAQKEALVQHAGEHTRTLLLSGQTRNVFDFGEVPVGGRKYNLVSVANIGFGMVKLKMSILNPYGPFTFCNSLKEIPTDNFYSLKFKFEPKEEEEYQETVKIEEVDKPESFIIIKLKGQGHGSEHHEDQ